MSSRSRGLSREAIRELERLAAKQYPALFSPPGSGRPKKPLKHRLVHDLAARGLVDAQGKPIARWRLRTLIHHYTRGPNYAQGLISFASRFDLDGNAVGDVTDLERSKAAGLLRRMLRQRAEQEADQASRREMRAAVAA